MQTERFAPAPSITMRQLFAVLLLMLATSFAVFGASTLYGFSILDDQFLVVTNLFIRGPTLRNLLHVFTHFDPELYIPLTLFSYQLNYVLGGLAPWTFHATNVILHGLNATLVYWLTVQCTGRKSAAVIAGLLFLLHPLNTEAVVWVAGRKDLLSTAGALLAVIFFIRFRETQGRTYLTAASVAFLCSLLSKSSALLLPIVLLLIDVGLERRSSLRSLVLEKSTMFVTALVIGGVALFGKTRVVGSSDVLETVLMAGKSTAFYVQKFVWPTGLNPLYPWVQPVTLQQTEFVIPMIALVVTLVCCVLLLRWSRVPLVAVLSALLLLAPSYFNFHKGETMFVAVDRYAYLPMVPVMMALAGSLAAWAHTWHRSMRRIGAGVLCLLFIVLGTASYRQTKLWADDTMLLEHSIAVTPDNVPARTSLAAIERERGSWQRERKIIEDGMALRNDLAYELGIGSIDAREGKLDAARKAYERAQALDPENPEPYFYLGSLAETEGKPDDALAFYRQAMALDDSYVAAINNAGGILMERGDLEAAKGLFADAVRWNPSFLEGEYNLFQIFAMQRMKEEARKHLEKAYALAPENHEVALSMAYAHYEAKEYSDARRILRNILREDPAQRTASRLLPLVEEALRQ